MKIWEFEERQSWCMQVECFRGHVATDGTPLGAAGKWGVCGWAVVQLNYDEEMMRPLHGVYCSMSWQRQEQCWMKALMAEASTETMKQEREEVYEALQHAASFHCLVEE